MSDTPTPRTDAESGDDWTPGTDLVLTVFARKLERELLASQAQEVALREALELMAGQRRVGELSDEQRESADFETGYETLVKAARAALSAPAPEVVPVDEVEKLVKALEWYSLFGSRAKEALAIYRAKHQAK